MTKTLWIAEKPSVAKMLAEALAGNNTRSRTAIHADNNTFTWVMGHMLELAEPADYDPAFKQWNYEDLPIIPEKFIHKVASGKKQQVDAIASLIKTHDVIIHAGDIGREGQLIVDEILNHLNNTRPVKRILINNPNPEPIREAANDLRDNSDFINLSYSARLRQLADWTVGINFSRAYSIESGVPNISIGRVQTPLLALIVKRDKDIEDFTSRKYYELTTVIENDDNQRITVTWQPGSAYDSILDEEGRIIKKPPLEKLIEDLTEQNGKIENATYKKGKTAPPLPFSLSALQSHVLSMREIKARPDNVLTAAQKLYEEYKLLTYPRSDCRFLPEEQHNHAPAVFEFLKNYPDYFGNMIKAADVTIKSRAYNDAKTGEHHALVPTGEGEKDLSKLSKLELHVFIACCQYYIAQFLPHQQHTTLEILADILEEKFRAKKQYITDHGYSRYLNIKDTATKDNTNNDDEEVSTDPIPHFENGEHVTSNNSVIHEKHTTPPKHFTGATLIAAMSNIARFVDDPEARKTLKETDGLGTEATRSAIINVLFQREFIIEKGKAYIATEKGRKLIEATDERIKSIEMTAAWESYLNDVATHGDNGEFLSSINEYVSILIKDLPAQDIAQVFNPHLVTCPNCHGRMSLRASAKGEFFGCSNYPDCKKILQTGEVTKEQYESAKSLVAKTLKKRTTTAKKTTRKPAKRTKQARPA